MVPVDKYSKPLKDALDQGVTKRLPLTFLPFVNQQLQQWEYLFPNERRSVEQLLLYVAGMSDAQSTALFRDVVAVEQKMEVRRWQFSTAEQTIQDASELARSPYYQEWRRAVQAVFDAADRHADQENGTSRHRVVLIEIPKILPLNQARVWRGWRGMGKPLKLDLKQESQNSCSLEWLLEETQGENGHASAGLLDAVRTGRGEAHADAWVVDAGKQLTGSLAKQKSATPGAAPVLLSYERLDLYRQNFSHEMNTMQKDLVDADAVYDRLRKVDVSAWCPPEVGGDPAVREFVRALYLSGNGAVIFGNSFVEWAASEAFRRARPALLAARFGVRSKPKPFTGVAVFENPEQVNPLPAVDDLEGSALDAQMLALYVWLAASRYREYQRSTVCVCVAESLAEAYVVAPSEFTLLQSAEPLSLDMVKRSLRDWIAQT